MEAESAPRVKIGEDETLSPTITPDHPDLATGHALIMKALGTTSKDFYNGILLQLLNAEFHDNIPDTESRLNFMLEVIKAIQPRDGIELMLAAQMAAVQTATMKFTRVLSDLNKRTSMHYPGAEGAFNRLMRTFVAQMDGLKRYRTGGQQSITVQHVNVGEGGQAIVGNVTQASRGTPQARAAASPFALTESQNPPMTSMGNPAPSAVSPRRKPKK
jgi:hypothetical protein